MVGLLWQSNDLDGKRKYLVENLATRGPSAHQNWHIAWSRHWRGMLILETAYISGSYGWESKPTPCSFHGNKLVLKSQDLRAEKNDHWRENPVLGVKAERDIGKPAKYSTIIHSLDNQHQMINSFNWFIYSVCDATAYRESWVSCGSYGNPQENEKTDTGKKA